MSGKLAPAETVLGENFEPSECNQQPMADRFIERIRTEEWEGARRIRGRMRALRHRNFRLFFVGQLISVIGTLMQMMAQSWLVYRLTGSSLALGSLGFASQLPILLLGPVGGLVADRYSRRSIVVATQTSSMLLAFILAWLTLSGRVQVWHVFVLGSALGIVNAFDFPGRQVLTVDMVGKEDLINAIALNSTMFNGARVVGPAIAGILVATIGEGWCFFVNGVSYLAVIAGLLMMRMPATESRRREDPVLDTLIGGFRFLRSARSLRSLILLISLVSLFGIPHLVLMPVFAREVLHSDARGFGLLTGCVGVGAVVAGVGMAARSGMRGLPRLAAIGCGASALALILFSQSRNLWLSMLLLLPVGFFMMVHMSSSQTLVQLMAPDELRGRVMAVFTMLTIGLSPFASFFAGALADRFGSPLTVTMEGMVCLGGAAWFAYRLPAMSQSTEAGRR